MNVLSLVFSSLFRCVIVPKGFKAAEMLLKLNRKIKKIGDRKSVV